MGIILLPGLLIHFSIFVLGVYLNTCNISGLTNKLKYIALSLFISFVAAYFFVRYMFVLNEEMKIYAFQILLDIAYGKHLIVIFLASLIMFEFFKEMKIRFFQVITASLLMFSFSSIILYFSCSEMFLEIYKIAINY